MNFSTIKPGIEATVTSEVTESNTACTIGSGDLDVYSTPSMVALMEAAALKAVASFLPDGYSTVGTELTIKHISATPIGMRVTAKAELISIDGKALSFKVEASDEAGLIGEGTHKRFIVEKEKFLAKAMGKAG